MIEESEYMYSKRFKFEKEANWKLPPLSEWYKTEEWQLKELQDMKIALNVTKSQLNDKNVQDWHEHTTFTHRTSGVIPELRKKIKPELLTQAWCKFYEILNAYPIGPSSSDIKDFNTVHLCEAPGAFVASLNHFIRSKYDDLNWTWLANTLNPYYEGNSTQETVMDDRFIIHTLDRWHFGRNSTGNIMESTYLEDIGTLVNGANIQLVTADGSIDCANDPGEQEITVTKLHLYEVVTALHILAKNGNLVLKMFTFYECSSNCLMFLLNCWFETVNVFKPATSKSGNSEVYVVCLKYIGSIGILPQLEFWYRHIDSPISTAMFKIEQIPVSFREQLKKCCAAFKEYQENEINRNLMYLGMSIVEQKNLQQIKEKCTRMYFEKYPITPIADRQRIIPFETGRRYLSLFQYGNINVTNRSSFNQRTRSQSDASDSRLKKLKNLQKSLHQFAPEKEIWKHEYQNIEPNETIFPNGFNQQMIQTGKALDRIISSIFCHPVLLKLWNEYVDGNPHTQDNLYQHRRNWTKHATDQIKKIGIQIVDESRRDLLPNVLISWDLDEKEDDFSRDVIPEIPKPQPTTHGLLYTTFSPDQLPGIEIRADLEKNKRLILKGCIQILQTVKENDIVVIRTATVLSRFVVGLLYLLVTLFDHCEVVPPQYYKMNEPSLWCFKKYRHSEWAERVLKHLEDVQTANFHPYLIEGMSVLEVVPLLALSASGFAEFVQNQNMVIMARTLLKNIQEEIWMIKNSQK